MTPNTLDAEAELEFPSSDGKPMSENTRQYEAIVTLKGNIEAFAPTDAFVAGDHLIYVDPTDDTDRQAPDVYVAFGRPREHRGSYKLWEEGGIFPQVIFEVLAPSNTPKEMQGKRAFYFGHGAEEYYEFDPEAGTWTGFVRDPATGQPEPVPEMEGHISPRLGMRFGFQLMGLLAFRPDGTRFLSFQELENRVQEVEQLRLADQRRAEEQRRELEGQRRAEQQRADEAQQLAEEANRRAEEERLRAEEEHRQREAERRRADDAERRAEEEHRQRKAERLRTEEERLRAEEANRRTEEEARQREAERLRADDAERRAEEEHRQREAERLRAEEATRRADEEARQREAERLRADEQQREAERMRALLRAAGIDPDATT